MSNPYQCLVLNADASPISILPLSVITWEEAIRYLVADKAVVVEWHTDVARSEHWTTPIPSVMMLREYKKKAPFVRFTKSNIFLRDEYKCQFCFTEVTRQSATIDHVVPSSLGGLTNWTNCTTSCATCNVKKGNNPKIVPRIKPYKPNYYALVDKRKRMTWDVPYASWLDYLS